MTYLALVLIAAACAVAFYNWRWGLFAAIFVGLAQDPLRKMMPGSPGWMAMASVPVWLTAMTAALYAGAIPIPGFLNRFPRMSRSLIWFAGYLILPAALSATYGRNSWQITLLGAMMYSAFFLALCCGFYYPLNTRMAGRFLGFYVILTSIFLVGGPLDSLGWSPRYAVIGTEALDHVWVTHRTGRALYMLAGLFRSPDVMGWHAALVFMTGMVLAMNSRGRMRLVWMALAVWGGANLWLCGRRKMIAMLPVFMGCYLGLIFYLRGTQRWLVTVALLLVTTGIGWYVITSYLQTDNYQQFYFSTFHEVGDSVRRHGFDSVMTTIRQAGFMGYGLGMGQQGLHHIGAETPRIWQESGPSKLIVEFGVPGTVLLVLLMIRLAQTGYHVLRATQQEDSFYVSAGLVAILAGNMASGVVSAQIFGDPFVAIMLALMLGLLFSAVRRQEEIAETLKG